MAPGTKIRIVFGPPPSRRRATKILNALEQQFDVPLFSNEEQKDTVGVAEPTEVVVSRSLKSVGPICILYSFRAMIATVDYLTFAMVGTDHRFQVDLLSGGFPRWTLGLL